ncbi:ATP-binding cassette domain-containing protein [Saccharococcus caldoxylosilyticus]|uniref:ATP-binding cassette domain-containing protein n=1 Tax=Saccharococcus caldoxylosilyticus TaxID=81408 RepID=UPI0004751FDD|nr:ATP-binding cassette domain-containing protein [Parageobacillus caldoxylosilyticus]
MPKKEHRYMKILRLIPMRYQTIISEGGSNLSGGKRQRLALARALIGKPFYLVARRGDCALDTVTERKIDDAIQQLNYTKL